MPKTITFEEQWQRIQNNRLQRKLADTDWQDQTPWIDPDDENPETD